MFNVCDTWLIGHQGCWIVYNCKFDHHPNSLVYIRIHIASKYFLKLIHTHNQTLLIHQNQAHANCQCQIQAHNQTKIKSPNIINVSRCITIIIAITIIAIANHSCAKFAYLPPSHSILFRISIFSWFACAYAHPDVRHIILKIRSNNVISLMLKKALRMTRSIRTPSDDDVPTIQCTRVSIHTSIHLLVFQIDGEGIPGLVWRRYHATTSLKIECENLVCGVRVDVPRVYR